MTTTPEQLQAWRGEFEVGLHRLTKIRSKCGLYVDHTVQCEWNGYLRRCREAEQAIKDAEKLRTVAINLIAACEEREGDDGERCYLVPAQEFDDLQELLND